MESVYHSDYGYDLCYETRGSGSEHALFVMGFSCNRAYWGNCITQIHALYPGKYCREQSKPKNTSVAKVIQKIITRKDGQDIARQTRSQGISCCVEQAKGCKQPHYHYWVAF